MPRFIYTWKKFGKALALWSALILVLGGQQVWGQSALSADASPFERTGVLWLGFALVFGGSLLALARFRKLARMRNRLAEELHQKQEEIANINQQWKSRFRNQGQNLRDKQHLLEGVLRNLPGMVYRAKFDGQYSPLYVSQGVSKLLGLTPDEIMEQGIVGLDKIPEPYHAYVIESSRKAIEEGGLHEVVFPIEVNGGWKWMQNRFFYSGIKVDGFPVTDGLIIDITEQRNAEMALRAREEMLTKILNGTHEYIVFVKVERPDDLRIETVNQRYIDGFTRLGITLDHQTIAGMEVRDFMRESLRYNEDAIAFRMDRISESINTRKAVYFDETISGKDGRMAYIESHVMPVFDEQGSCSHLIYSSWDITRRKMEDERILSAIIETEDRERTRIAKEIHDSLGQTLTSAVMNLHLLRPQIPENSPLFSSLHAAYVQIQTAIDESRRMAYNLMPKAIHDFGLTLALESQIQQLKSASDIRFQFRHNIGAERLPLRWEKSLYRIAQIALDNALKHADASCISLQLQKHDRGVSFMIEDNGRGFDPEQIAQKEATIGLSSLKTRAQSLGGSVDISSAPGKGTLIHVEIPFAPTHESHKNSVG
ncbi:MAG: ATP-binding protein [Bacteroidota bacterium]